MPDISNKWEMSGGPPKRRAAMALWVSSDRFGCLFLWFFLLGKQKK